MHHENDGAKTSYFAAMVRSTTDHSCHVACIHEAMNILHNSFANVFSAEYTQQVSGVLSNHAENVSAIKDFFPSSSAVSVLAAAKRTQCLKHTTFSSHENAILKR